MYKYLSTLVLFAIPGVVGAVDGKPDLRSYEIPAPIKRETEKKFYEESYKYEAALSNIQLILLVDRSGSQQAPDAYPLEPVPPNLKGMFGKQWTQWDNTFMLTKYLAESMLQYDKDKKLPLIFFGREAKDIVVSDIGSMLLEFNERKPTNENTNLYDALDLAFKKHIPQDPNENALFIVLTDGAPDDGTEPEIKQLIKEKITKVDPKGDRLNLLFLRIGDDEKAKRFLADLDEDKEIGGNVDTKSDNMAYKMGPKSLILNAIYEHLDEKYKE